MGIIDSKSIAIIALELKLDTHTAETLKAKVRSGIRSLGRDRFVIDMVNVTLGDATAFGSIINCLGQAMEVGGTLVLANCSKHVLSVIERMRFNEAVQVYNTVDEAVAALKIFEPPTL